MQVNVHFAKTHLSRLLERAAGGEEIVIAKAGKPFARLGPLAPAPLHDKRQWGALKGQIHMAPDFDELPADFLAAFYGEDEPKPRRKTRRSKSKKS